MPYAPMGSDPMIGYLSNEINKLAMVCNIEFKLFRTKTRSSRGWLRCRETTSRRSPR